MGLHGLLRDNFSFYLFLIWIYIIFVFTKQNTCCKYELKYVSYSINYFKYIFEILTVFAYKIIRIELVNIIFLLPCIPTSRFQNI
jgi:hypothetical protein